MGPPSPSTSSPCRKQHALVANILSNHTTAFSSHPFVWRLDRRLFHPKASHQVSNIESSSKTLPRAKTNPRHLQHDDLQNHPPLRRRPPLRPPREVRRRQVQTQPQPRPTRVNSPFSTSKIRQVPNNQEVYIDKDGFTSIIFDITERVGPKSSSSSSSSSNTNLETDGRALTTHLEELVGDDADTVKVWNTTETSFSHLEYAPYPPPYTTQTPTNPPPPHSTSIPAYTLIATQTPNKPKDDRPSGGAPDFTALILTLLRLEKEETDVLITINVPHIMGEYDEDEVDLELGKQGKLIGDAVEYAARIWSSLDVKDWGLFSEV